VISVSLCMIVKNEERTLPRCLNSIRDAVDEIIVVDTGSDDRTREIAAELGARVHDFPWIDDFAAARNFAYSKAEMDYIMWLDADDILAPGDAAQLIALKAELPAHVDAVMMQYATLFDERGRPTFSYYRERLTRRASGFAWKEPVHEYLAVSGNVITSPICVLHTKRPARPASGGRNIRIYERLLESGGQLTPRGMYYYARELRDNGRFEEAARKFELYLESGLGWAEDNINACAELAGLYEGMGKTDCVLPTLFRSFLYDLPRAEILCRIGQSFQKKGAYRMAIYWFERALGAERPENSIGFTQPDAWGYLPAIELCVCYDKLNDTARAAEYNERAAQYKPDSKAVLHNRRYFAQKLSPAVEEA
jgi:glycosyltransferase involved in cell wall biosynthesis